MIVEARTSESQVSRGRGEEREEEGRERIGEHVVMDNRRARDSILNGRTYDTFTKRIRCNDNEQNEEKF